MPYYYFKEIWTPIKLIGVRLFIDEENKLWIKVGKGERRKILMKNKQTR